MLDKPVRECGADCVVTVGTAGAESMHTETSVKSALKNVGSKKSAAEKRYYTISFTAVFFRFIRIHPASTQLLTVLLGDHLPRECSTHCINGVAGCKVNESLGVEGEALRALG